MIAYSVADLAALQGHRDQALALLRESLDHGLPPSLALRIRNDDDLKSLQGDPQFAAIVAAAGKRAAAQKAQ